MLPFFRREFFRLRFVCASECLRSLVTVAIPLVGAAASESPWKAGLWTPSAIPWSLGWPPGSSDEGHGKETTPLVFSSFLFSSHFFCSLSK